MKLEGNCAGFDPLLAHFPTASPAASLPPTAHCRAASCAHMPSATATLSEFLRPNQPEIVRGERRLARGCPWSEPLGPRHGSRTTASQRASSSGARPCLIPGHLGSSKGSSRLISRPISGRRSRVGRGAANLRESLKRRLRGHFGEEQRRPGPTPAPRRSLPSSSAHPAGGGGKANSCAYGAPATVSTATTGTPAARSSSIAVSARRRLSRFTAVREAADR